MTRPNVCRPRVLQMLALSAKPAMDKDFEFARGTLQKHDARSHPPESRFEAAILVFENWKEAFVVPSFVAPYGSD